MASLLKFWDFIGLVLSVNVFELGKTPEKNQEKHIIGI